MRLPNKKPEPILDEPATYYKYLREQGLSDADAYDAIESMVADGLFGVDEAYHLWLATQETSRLQAKSNMLKLPYYARHDLMI